jgi:hypothetical protein
MDNYGFILTRHVNSEKTNRYWNNCIQCLRRFYPLKKIIIIDDNSNYSFVKADYEYNNIEIIQSEFPGRGELLPYYYFFKKHFFENAVIIHDSVFFHKKIMFEKFGNRKVLPLWHFNNDNEDISRTMNIIQVLNNKYIIQQKLSLTNKVLGFNQDIWYGCFGVQSYINHSFLTQIMYKYQLCNLIKIVRNRSDRCCLERIFGIIFSLEYPILLKQKSLLGDIFNYQKWGYTYESYEINKKEKKIPNYIVKIWTGR